MYRPTQPDFEPSLILAELCDGQARAVDRYAIAYRAVVEHLCSIRYRQLVGRGVVDGRDLADVLDWVEIAIRSVNQGRECLRKGKSIEPR